MSLMKILQVDLQAVQVDLQQAHSLHSQTSQFFAGRAAFFNYGSQKIMDELVARVFAAAEGVSRRWLTRSSRQARASPGSP